MRTAVLTTIGCVSVLGMVCSARLMGIDSVHFVPPGRALAAAVCASTSADAHGGASRKGSSSATALVFGLAAACVLVSLVAWLLTSEPEDECCVAAMKQLAVPSYKRPDPFTPHPFTPGSRGDAYVRARARDSGVILMEGGGRNGPCHGAARTASMPLSPRHLHLSRPEAGTTLHSQPHCEGMGSGSYTPWELNCGGEGGGGDSEVPSPIALHGRASLDLEEAENDGVRIAILERQINLGREIQRHANCSEEEGCVPSPSSHRHAPSTSSSASSTSTWPPAVATSSAASGAAHPPPASYGSCMQRTSKLPPPPRARPRPASPPPAEEACGAAATDPSSHASFQSRPLLRRSPVGATAGGPPSPPPPPPPPPPAGVEAGDDEARCGWCRATAEGLGSRPIHQPVSSEPPPCRSSRHAHLGDDSNRGGSVDAAASGDGRRDAARFRGSIGSTGGNDEGLWPLVRSSQSACSRACHMPHARRTRMPPACTRHAQSRVDMYEHAQVSNGLASVHSSFSTLLANGAESSQTPAYRGAAAYMAASSKVGAAAHRERRRSLGAQPNGSGGVPVAKRDHEAALDGGGGRRSTSVSPALIPMAEWHRVIRLHPGAPVCYRGERGVVRRANPMRETYAVHLVMEQRTVDVPFAAADLHADVSSGAALSPTPATANPPGVCAGAGSRRSRPSVECFSSSRMMM